MGSTKPMKLILARKKFNEKKCCRNYYEKSKFKTKYSMNLLQIILSTKKPIQYEDNNHSNK